MGPHKVPVPREEAADVVDPVVLDVDPKCST